MSTADPPVPAGRDLDARLAAARSALAENEIRMTEALSQLRTTRGELTQGRTRREQLHDSAYGRLAARLETMPVIEQAKGILIARTGCTPAEAFDLLRQASQRSNVRVAELAADIVSRAIGRRQEGRDRPSGRG